MFHIFAMCTGLGFYNVNDLEIYMITHRSL